jgi:hypothetical protein
MPNSNTNDFNLNDDQIERLAEAIVEKLFIKQEEADAKFIADLEASNSKADIYIVNNDGSVLSELEQQIKLLEQEFEVALKKELYNTAADLDLKLKMLKKQRDENNNTDDEIRAGASELVKDCIENKFNPGNADDVAEWVEETFDSNCIGVLCDDAWQEAVWEILHDEINDMFYQFINDVKTGMYEKAALSITSLYHDRQDVGL